MTTKQVQAKVVTIIAQYGDEIIEQYGVDMQSSMTISGIQGRITDDEISQGQVVYAIRELVKDGTLERRGAVKAPKYAIMGEG